MNRIPLDYLQLERAEAFLVCLGPLIVCIGVGKIVLLHVMGCTGDIKRSLQLYWKQFHEPTELNRQID